jgi:hypothetical protein
MEIILSIILMVLFYIFMVFGGIITFAYIISPFIGTKNLQCIINYYIIMLLPFIFIIIPFIHSNMHIIKKFL